MKFPPVHYGPRPPKEATRTNTKSEYITWRSQTTPVLQQLTARDPTSNRPSLKASILHMQQKKYSGGICLPAINKITRILFLLRHPYFTNPTPHLQQGKGCSTTAKHTGDQRLNGSSTTLHLLSTPQNHKRTPASTCARAQQVTSSLGLSRKVIFYQEEKLKK